jgi:paraquat-inducible protein B
MTSDLQTPPPALPEAKLGRAGAARAVWLLPIAALAGAIWLTWTMWLSHGPAIEIHFGEGHGLKAGDAVRHRGVDVGRVLDVTLSEDFQRVVVRVALEPWAEGLVREGASFWVVRPEVGLHRVSGLETIVGARYLVLAASPRADAPLVTRFTGIDQPRVTDSAQPGDLRILLTTTRRGGLVRGAPVTYRQIPVGTVVDVRLAADARVVEAVAVVEAPYVALVRETSRFWAASGFDLTFGLKGLSARVDSIESLVAGGVAFATPDEPAAPAKQDARFELADEPDGDWLEWQPAIEIGASVGAGPPVK